MRTLVALFVLGCLALTLRACSPPSVRPPGAGPARTQPARSAAAKPNPTVFRPALAANTSAPIERAKPSRVTTGPGWVPIDRNPAGVLAFSANGLWFATFVDSGVLLGDSQSGQPLAVAPFVFEKSNALAFHPSSSYLVAVADFTVLVLAIETQQGRVRLRREADLPVTRDLGLVPPAFDRTGRYLALAGDSDVTLYDFNGRRPLLHVYPGFSSGAWLMGFSADTLYFVEPTTSPCRCDDYGGSDAAVVSFHLGGSSARRIRAQGDMVGPLHLRQARVAAATGWWDARSGRRRARYRLDADARLIHVYRLRARRAAVGVQVRGNGDACELVILSDDGRVRSLGVLPEMPLYLAVRPQDDMAMFWSLDQERTLWFIDLANGQSRSLKLPERLCIEEGQRMPDERCPPSGAELARPSLNGSPAFEVELPVVMAPEDTNPRGGSGRRMEGEVDGVLLRR
ncbi:MAG: WD40 repeat domain-containing protein [Polyangiaceae bacterium]|nr:WD40 repeat domain-containing protein [Polyangiaceae bacterium]